ncbi:hypothetical protein [Oryza sativa Japonica Group]|uniref:Uncharacterized protein P0702F03.17 n=1 Tax=Oryza sativa subsp. japonica TaxID=39947 RepID=Q5NAX1_ORYSJ|nr:hypothetical protein DAI22_01g094400 [Oryza sativa Japonica Group]BAD81378.1 hypothetical protein [Oryza sativa Japonica Group]
MDLVVDDLELLSDGADLAGGRMLQGEIDPEVDGRRHGGVASAASGHRTARLFPPFFGPHLLPRLAALLPGCWLEARGYASRNALCGLFFAPSHESPTVSDKEPVVYLGSEFFSL